MLVFYRFFAVGDRKRKIKGIAGSKKTRATCSAHIIKVVEDNKPNVKYWLTHICHQNEPQSSKEDKINSLNRLKNVSINPNSSSKKSRKKVNSNFRSNHQFESHQSLNTLNSLNSINPENNLAFNETEQGFDFLYNYIQNNNQQEGNLEILKNVDATLKYVDRINTNDEYNMVLRLKERLEMLCNNYERDHLKFR